MRGHQAAAIVAELPLDQLSRASVSYFHVELADNALGVPWRVPVVIIEGVKPGPTVGITAALHGDELNGSSTIFKLIESVDPQNFLGRLILVPISNTPGYLLNQRYFPDGVDLNRIMPGKRPGSPSHLYAHYFTQKVARHFHYLLDLHTASDGRVNTLYVRADLEKEETRTLAYLQNPQIIVQKYDEGGTLRSWAADQGIPGITIEIGNPNTFQHNLIDETLEGVINTLRYLKMMPGAVENHVHNTIICDHSYWIHSTKGGIVDVLPKLADPVEGGEVIARVYDIFGRVREEVRSDRSGIVIGKNTRPNCQSGTRLLHLGVNLSEPDLSSVSL